MSRIDLMGCPVDALTMEQTLARIEQIIDAGVPRQHMAMNANKFLSMASDPELRRVVRNSALVNADGAAIVHAARVLGTPLPERVAGVDIMQRVMAMAPEKGWRIYLLGAKQQVVDDVERIAKERHPGIQIAGSRNGYFEDEDEPEIVAQIREARADVIFVAISSPKKEKFLGRWMSEMRVPFCMGVGGSFDVMAGVVSRAPRWMQEHSLEWSWRLMQEPRRMWRRNVYGNGGFALQVLRGRLRGYRLPD